MANGKNSSGIIINIGKLLITIIIITLIIRKLGWNNIVSSLANANYFIIFTALLLFFLSGILGVLQWQMLLKNKNFKISFKKAFTLYFIGMFFNNFIFGFIAGDAVKVALVKAQKGDTKSSLAATVLDRFAGLMAMAGLAIFGSAILLKNGMLTNGKIFTAVLALSGAFILFSGILLFLLYKPVQTLIFKILSTISFPLKSKIIEMLNKIAFESGNKKIVLPVALTATLIQIMRVGVHILCAAALGLLTVHNFQYFFIFVPILAMLMVIPMPFGIKEGIGGSLFLLAGFSPDTPQAPIVMEFLASLVGITTGLIGGVLFITSKLNSNYANEVS